MGNKDEKIPALKLELIFALRDGAGGHEKFHEVLFFFEANPHIANEWGKKMYEDVNAQKISVNDAFEADMNTRGEDIERDFGGHKLFSGDMD